MIFKVLSDKREMESRKVNNMDDEEEAMLGPRFGAELKVVEVDSKERNGRNDKKELKNYVFPFRMIMRKFRTVMQNGPENNFGCNSKGKLKTDFA